MTPGLNGFRGSGAQARPGFYDQPMADSLHPFSHSPAELALDPEVLASELAEELLGDPLDDLDIDAGQADGAAECDLGLELLQGSPEERMQGLRIFCEYRDPRAPDKLLPLLGASCPIQRMSAVYALGRNPALQAVTPLLALLQNDSIDVCGAS